MCAIQNAIEDAGIASVSINLMPDMARRAGVPRCVGVEMPYGHPCGHAGDAAEQTTILRAALRLLDEATEPAIVELEEPRWQGEADWHPPEPSPIIKLLIEQRRREARDRREG